MNKRYHSSPDNGSGEGCGNVDCEYRDRCDRTGENCLRHRRGHASAKERTEDTPAASANTFMSATTAERIAAADPKTKGRGPAAAVTEKNAALKDADPTVTGTGAALRTADLTVTEASAALRTADLTVTEASAASRTTAPTVTEKGPLLRTILFVPC